MTINFSAFWESLLVDSRHAKERELREVQAEIDDLDHALRIAMERKDRLVADLKTTVQTERQTA